MSQRDLFVVVADLDAENAVKTLLNERQEALEIRLDFSPDRHPQGDLLRYSGRDSGCYKDAVDVLRPLLNTHRHALLIFDRDGSGAESKSREAIENEVEQRLFGSGWTDERVAVIVIDPELESWVWGESPHVAAMLGWPDERDAMRAFLESRDLWHHDERKPHDPKEAMRQALREKRKPTGARLFAQLAAKVSFRDCQDEAFKKLWRRLQQWFGVNGNQAKSG